MKYIKLFSSKFSIFTSEKKSLYIAWASFGINVIAGAAWKSEKMCPRHQDNVHVMYTPLNPTFIYSKTGVCRGIPIFLIFDPKHRL